MGWFGLWFVMRPFIIGAEGFRFGYIHLNLVGLSVLPWFIVFLIWFWNVFVGSMLMVWMWFSDMKLFIFLLKCCVGRVTIEFLVSLCNRGFIFLEFCFYQIQYIHFWMCVVCGMEFVSCGVVFLYVLLLVFCNIHGQGQVDEL
jgi:hypothetical protein